MRGFFATIFGGFLSWWGLWLIVVFDSTMVFFLLLAVDIAVVILVSRNREFFWLYPILVSVGSLFGAALTYYIGRGFGEVGLERYVFKKRLVGFRRRIEEKGVVALAILDLILLSFPFTVCVLAAGALKV